MMALTTLHKGIFDNLNSIYPLTLEQFEPFKKILKTKTYKKGTIILNEGDIDDKLTYTASGIVHQYIYIQEQLYTIDIKVSGMFYNDLKSYMERSPCREIHEAVTDVELVTFSKTDFEALQESHHIYCQIYLKALEFKFLERENRAFILQHSSAAKRFALFMEMNNNANRFLLEVPQKLLATYLALTPETFSKVKKDYFKNHRS